MTTQTNNTGYRSVGLFIIDNKGYPCCNCYAYLYPCLNCKNNKNSKQTTISWEKYMSICPSDVLKNNCGGIIPCTYKEYCQKFVIPPRHSLDDK